MARPDEIVKSSWMSTLASTAVVIAALYMAKSLLVPLTLAVLLSFLLMPVCDWLERRQVGPYPGCVGDGHPGLHDAGDRGLDRSRSNDPFGPQDPRVSEQYPGEAKLGERVRSSRAEQDHKKSAGSWPESLAFRTDRRATRDHRTALLGARHLLANEPTANLWRHVRHTARDVGHNRHRHRARGVLPDPA